jgi:hypothetical protein
MAAVATGLKPHRHRLLFSSLLESVLHPTNRTGTASSTSQHQLPSVFVDCPSAEPPSASDYRCYGHRTSGSAPVDNRASKRARCPVVDGCAT